MNKEILCILDEHHLHPLAYTKKGKVYFVSDRKNTYVIKLKTDNYDIYQYLLARDFNHFPENFNNVHDNYDLSLYIEDIKEDKVQKINDLIKVTAILHNKTSYQRTLDLDEVKKIYEELKQKILDTEEYYFQLNDVIDEELFLSPDDYLLIRHISLFYSLLSSSQEKLNKWYQDIQKEKSVRITLNHNNLSLDHLIINDTYYLINWDKASFDMPIIELEFLIRKYSNVLEIEDILKIYEKYYILSPLEKVLLFIKLSIPQITSKTKNNFQNTKDLYHEISFLKRVSKIVLDKKLVK